MEPYHSLPRLETLQPLRETTVSSKGSGGHQQHGGALGICGSGGHRQPGGAPGNPNLFVLVSVVLVVVVAVVVVTVAVGGTVYVVHQVC